MSAFVESKEDSDVSLPGPMEDSLDKAGVFLVNEESLDRDVVCTPVGVVAPFDNPWLFIIMCQGRV